MLIQYAYIRPRSQFGKQCFFEETDPIVEENILPNPELMRDYIHRSRCHRGVQKSEQFALHEVRESLSMDGTKFELFGMLYIAFVTWTTVRNFRSKPREGKKNDSSWK